MPWSPAWNSRCSPKPTQPSSKQLPPKLDPFRQGARALREERASLDHDVAGVRCGVRQFCDPFDTALLDRPTAASVDTARFLSRSPLHTPQQYTDGRRPTTMTSMTSRRDTRRERSRELGLRPTHLQIVHRGTDNRGDGVERSDGIRSARRDPPHGRAVGTRQVGMAPCQPHQRDRAVDRYWCQSRAGRAPWRRHGAHAAPPPVEHPRAARRARVRPDSTP